jgi:hypothetical protein
MLGKRMSLEEIAEKLNVEKVPTDSRHEQMDSSISSEGIRFLEAARSPGSKGVDNESPGGTHEQIDKPPAPRG